MNRALPASFGLRSPPPPEATRWSARDVLPSSTCTMDDAGVPHQTGVGRLGGKVSPKSRVGGILFDWRRQVGPLLGRGDRELWAGSQLAVSI
jgi:hypothetical protein